jgi:hypothetical protein
MTLQDLKNLPKGWLIHVKNFPARAGVYVEGTRDTNKLKKLHGQLAIIQYGEVFAIGFPVSKTGKATERWGVKCLAAHLKFGYSSEKQTIKAMPIQDLVKYINYLTDAGAEYLKELKL